jgi:ketosteroid isomerase-like protein
VDEEQVHATVRILLDRTEIADVLYRFALALDTNDFASLGTCFSEDALWDYGPGAGPVLQGAAAIEDFVRTSYSDKPVTAGGALIRHAPSASHHVSNVLVEFDGIDSAVVDAYVYAYHEMHDGTAGVSWGRFHDRFRRTEDGWRISARQMLVAGTDNFPRFGYPVLSH